MAILTNESEQNVKQFRVELSGISSSHTQELFASRLNDLGWTAEIDQGFWQRFKAGGVDREPTTIIVADLSKVAAEFQNTTRQIWSCAFRKTRPSVIALVRNKRDLTKALLLDDLLRSSAHRLLVCKFKETLKETIKEIAVCLERASAVTDPSAILDIRYSSRDEFLWIEFGDGLSVTLPWTKLELQDRNPSLQLETVTVAEDDPYTVELLDAEDDTFDIDSASLRSLVDKNYAEEMDEKAKTVMANVGQRLKEKRIAKKLTQEKLGNTTGLQQGLISKLESGQHQPRFDTLRRYATGLDLSVEELLAP